MKFSINIWKTKTILTLSVNIIVQKQACGIVQKQARGADSQIHEPTNSTLRNG